MTVPVVVLSSPSGAINTHADQSHDPLLCDEHFLSSPGAPTSDSYMEYGLYWGGRSSRTTFRTTLIRTEVFFSQTIFQICRRSRRSRRLRLPSRWRWACRTRSDTPVHRPRLRTLCGSRSWHTSPPALRARCCRSPLTASEKRRNQTFPVWFRWQIQKTKACFLSPAAAVCVFCAFSLSSGSSSSDLHSYARPPPVLPSSAPSPPAAPGRERRRSRVEPRPTFAFSGFQISFSSIWSSCLLYCWIFIFAVQTSSECGSAVSTRSSLSDDEDMGWSFSWPPTAWHCFLKGRPTALSSQNSSFLHHFCFFMGVTFILHILLMAVLFFFLIPVRCNSTLLFILLYFFLFLTGI